MSHEKPDADASDGSQPARANTDERLRSERTSADDAVAAIESAAADADDRIVRSRKQADSVLVADRDRADRKLAGSGPHEAAPIALARGRAQEDDIVLSERDDADEIHRSERDEQLRALRALLPQERDETDRSLEDERAHADDAVERRDDFLGMVSHDLKSLLNGIALSASLIQRGDASGEPPRATAERILRAAGQMSRLIDDLMDVVSIGAGRLAVRPARADAVALVVEAAHAFAPAASNKGLTLVAKVAERPLSGTFDHARLSQVLANLISNAMKFTPPGGSITVAGSRSGTVLQLAVADTGSGIPGELLEAVFDRFWQAGENERRGLGLGLYISRGIVETHGGRIWAESEPGEGTTIHVTIPDPPPSARPYSSLETE